jgi:hypothetical protein
MTTQSYVTVTAPEGRRTPVHSDDGIEPGGNPLVITSDDVGRVRYSQTTARSIARGDLLLCNMDGSPVASVNLAAAKESNRGPKWRTAKRQAELEAEERAADLAKAKQDLEKTAGQAPAPKKGA